MNNIVENMKQIGQNEKFVAIFEYRISFTMLSLQKLVKNC